MVKLMEPQLLHCIRTKEDHRLLMALLDLDVRTDAEFDCLCDEYQDILRRKDSIETSQTIDSIVLDRIYGLLTDCYIDRFKLKGISVKQKIPQLLKLLANYDYERIVIFLDQTSGNAGARVSFDLNDDNVNDYD